MRHLASSLALLTLLGATASAGNSYLINEAGGELSIPLDFLAPDTRYDVTYYEDGSDIRPYVEYLHAVIRELCERYQPVLIWFDASRRFRNPDQKRFLRQADMVEMLHSYGALSNSRLGDDDALKYVDYLTMNDNMAADFTLFGLHNKVQKASLLATGEAIGLHEKFDAAAAGHLVILNIPTDPPDDPISVIELVVAGDPVMDPQHLQLTDGRVLLDAYNATIHDLEYVPGKPTKAIDMKMFTVPDRRLMLPSDYKGPWDYHMYRKPGEGTMPGRGLTVSGFHTKGQALSWDFKVYKPGTYEVVVVCRTSKGRAWNVEGRLRAHVAGQSVENQLIESKRVMPPTTNSRMVDLHSVLGTVEIHSAGAHTLTLEIASSFTGTKPLLRSVMLVPVSQGK